MTAMDFQKTMDQATDHLRAGRLVEAEALLRRALAQKPDHADAMHLLGCTLSKMNRLAEAEDWIRRAIAADARQAVFYNNLGLVLASQGRREAAVDAYRQAIALKPEMAEAYNNLGNVLGDIGQFDDALRSYKQALALRPDNPDYHYNLGNCRLGRARAMKLDVGMEGAASAIVRRDDELLEAIACFKRALALKSDYSDAQTNLGAALQSMGRKDEAIAAWRRAAVARPNALALYNLGRALYEIDQVDEAIAAMNRSLQLQPQNQDTWNNLGNIQLQLGKLDDALGSFQRAIAIQPDHAFANSNRLYVLSYHPGYDWAAILAEHKQWNQRRAAALKQLIQPHDNNCSKRRLKIGYVSPNFWCHCQALFMAPLLANHDYGDFQIYCYSDVKTPDAITQRLRGGADVWKSIVGMTDQEVADLIRQDGIDILVDLSVHMAENRLLVFARKPAPVQVTWLGYPGTTGLETMDYRLTDPLLDPPGETDAFYTERSVRLPHTFWCFDPMALDTGDAPRVNPLPALRAGYVTFGCLNNFCKVNQPLLDLWAAVLAAVPSSRLLLLAPPGSPRDWVRKTLGNRVDFVSRRPRRQYLEYYDRIDLGLDTLPYNGHTTSLDSLWMGVPVVTLVGKTLVGRAGLSQLTNLGLSELSARTPEEFVKLAADWAGDLPRLAELRGTLRDRMAASPLMDAKLFARDIETAYRSMWQTWCLGKSEIRASV
jgi:predicted O-linked N-acetylglucosamine transferase (SPINDLY family)